MNDHHQHLPIIFFGGSFDPPHIGHQQMIAHVLDVEPLDHLLMAPTYEHPFGKKHIASFMHRMAMCEIMSKMFEKVRVTNIEKTLQTQGKTLICLQALKQQFPQHPLKLILGSDQIAHADQWYRFDEIRKIAELLILSRPHFPEKNSSQVIMPDVSSTEIRKRCEKKKSLDGLVSKPIEDYIYKHQIYQNQ